MSATATATATAAVAAAKATLWLAIFFLLAAITTFNHWCDGGMFFYWPIQCFECDLQMSVLLQPLVLDGADADGSHDFSAWSICSVMAEASLDLKARQLYRKRCRF